MSSKSISMTRVKLEKTTSFPSVHNKKIRTINGYPLLKDAWGYYYLKPDPKKTSTKIRVEVPYELGFSLELTKDRHFTDGSITKETS
jgi:hypothetical protein